MLPWAGWFGCISCLGSFGVNFVHFSGLCAFGCSVAIQYMGVSIVWMAYMYIFLDQRFTNYVHVAS